MTEQTPFHATGMAEDGPPAPVPDPVPIGAMSFEAAMAELERLVGQLERGQLDLEASIKAFERGTALRQHCEQKLSEARLRVEKIAFDGGGEAKLEPFEAE